MKISQINFNLSTSNLNSQKVFLNQLPAKINFQRKNQDAFTKSESFSNEKAISLLRTKLETCMSREELNIYMEKFKRMCKRLGIEPRDLPIDSNHQGNLTPDQRMQISFLVKEDAIST